MMIISHPDDTQLGATHEYIPYGGKPNGGILNGGILDGRKPYGGIIEFEGNFPIDG